MPELDTGEAAYDPFEPTPPDDRTSRLTDGATFILDSPGESPAIWGVADGSVLWAGGEGMMLAGPQGVGKSTVAQQVALRRAGVHASPLLGLPVQPATGKVFYLAMDRPNQISRSFRRMVDEGNREVLTERLVVWRGPLPFNPVKEPGLLADFAEAEGAEDIFVDSYKDLAPGLVQDDVGAQINLAVQEVIARGMQWFGLHHQRKATSDNRRPNALDDVYGSNWLTAGLGSVALLWGRPGSRAVELTHLKQPAEPVGPIEFLHDHPTGTSTACDSENDLLARLVALGSVGISEQEAAAFLYGDGEDSAHRKKARRRLDGLVRGNCATFTEGRKGGSGGDGSPARWVAK